MLKKYNLTLFKLFTYIIFLTTPLESIGALDGSVSFSLTKMAILFQFLLFLPFLSTTSKIRFNSAIILFMALGGYWLLSCFWAMDFYHAFENLLSFYFPSVLMMITISTAIDSKKDIMNILWSFLLGCIVLAINCHFAKDEILANALYADQERVSTLGQDHNELSFMLNMGIVILFYTIGSFKKPFFKYLFILVILFLVYAIMLTGSRTGIITTILVFLLFLHNYKVNRFFVSILLIALLPVVISIIPESTIERLLSTSDSIKTGDFTSRGTIWKKGFDAFVQENMFLGVGYQNFSKMMINYYSWSVAAHNTYLSYLFTGGVVALFIFCLIIRKLFVYCIRIYRNTSNSFCFAFLIPLLIAMFTLETQYRRWIFLIAIVLSRACEFSEKIKIKK